MFSLIIMVFVASFLLAYPISLVKTIFLEK